MSIYQRIIRIVPTLMFIFLLEACDQVRSSNATSTVYIKAEKAYSKNQMDLAKTYYLELLTQKPVNTNVFFKLGNISMRQSQWNKAITYYTEVLKKQPDHEKTHHNLAMLHLSRAHEHISFYINRYPIHNDHNIQKLIDAISDYSLSTSNASNPSSSTELVPDISNHDRAY